MVGIRVVLWSLEVQLLCQFLWDGQGKRKKVKVQPSPSRIPRPCSLPSQALYSSNFLLLATNPVIMQKFQVQPTQGRDMGQIWGRTEAVFKRPGLQIKKAKHQATL